MTYMILCFGQHTVKLQCIFCTFWDTPQTVWANQHRQSCGFQEISLSVVHSSQCHTWAPTCSKQNSLTTT